MYFYKFHYVLNLILNEITKLKIWYLNKSKTFIFRLVTNQNIVLSFALRFLY